MTQIKTQATEQLILRGSGTNVQTHLKKAKKKLSIIFRFKLFKDFITFSLNGYQKESNCKLILVQFWGGNWKFSYHLVGEGIRQDTLKISWEVTQISRNRYTLLSSYPSQASTQTLNSITEILDNTDSLKLY